MLQFRLALLASLVLCGEAFTPYIRPSPLKRPHGDTARYMQKATPEVRASELLEIREPAAPPRRKNQHSCRAPCPICIVQGEGITPGISNDAQNLLAAAFLTIASAGGLVVGALVYDGSILTVEEIPIPTIPILGADKIPLPWKFLPADLKGDVVTTPDGTAVRSPVKKAP